MFLCVCLLGGVVQCCCVCVMFCVVLLFYGVAWCCCCGMRGHVLLFRTCVCVFGLCGCFVVLLSVVVFFFLSVVCY